MNWKFLKRILGVILLLIGVFALVTPLTPGSWLIFIGAEMAGIGLLSHANILRYHGKAKDWLGRRKEKKEEQ